MILKKLKIFTRIAQLEKKVEELDDLVAYLLHENDSNIALIEEHEKRIKTLETKLEDTNTVIDYLYREKESHKTLIEEHDREIEAIKLKALLKRIDAVEAIHNDELSKFKYDETEC